MKHAIARSRSLSLLGGALAGCAVVVVAIALLRSPARAQGAQEQAGQDDQPRQGTYRPYDPGDPTQDQGNAFGDVEGNAFGNDEGNAFGNDQGNAFGNEEGNALGNDEGNAYGATQGNGFGGNDGNAFPGGSSDGDRQ